MWLLLLGAVDALGVARRDLLLFSSSSSLLASTQPNSACKTTTNAVFSRRRCERVGLVGDERRLIGCQASENCVSSSAITSPSQFGPPWSFAPATSNATVALDSLVEALGKAGCAVVDVDRDVFYVHATAPTTIQGYAATEVDDLEFKLDPKEELVFYRSVSRESVFFIPTQNLYSVPLSDGNSNRERLDTIRKMLGWQSLGPLYTDEDDDPNDYIPLRSS